MARAAQLAAINSRFDELEGSINTSESSEVTVLERELCAVDAALESWRVGRSAVAEAAASLDDADLEIRNAELTARLDGLESQLVNISALVIEPSRLELVVDTSALLLEIAAIGKVISPRALAATDFVYKDTLLYMRPGRTDVLRFVIQNAMRSEELSDAFGRSLAASAAATLVDASLEAVGSAPQTLQVTVNFNIGERCVAVSLTCPPDVPDGSIIRISAVSMWGLPVSGIAGPLSIPIRHGLFAPLRVTLSSREDVSTRSLCISRAGQFYVSQERHVLVFNPDGVRISVLAHENNYFLERTTVYAAFADGDNPSLMLCDGGTLVAIEPISLSRQWASELQHEHRSIGVTGLTTLPGRGMVVVSFATSMRVSLYVHRLSDGARLGSLLTPYKTSFFLFSSHLASDPRTGAIYVNVFDGMFSFRIARLSWSTDDAIMPRAEGVVGEGIEASDPLPLAIVPPAPGKTVYHLVICSSGGPREDALYVLALPGHEVVHKHTFNGSKVAALATDPCSRVLAVCEEGSRSMHTLPWPLPGMPELK